MWFVGICLGLASVFGFFAHYVVPGLQAGLLLLLGVSRGAHFDCEFTVILRFCACRGRLRCVALVVACSCGAWCRNGLKKNVAVPDALLRRLACEVFVLAVAVFFLVRVFVEK